MNGTTYHSETPAKVRALLETLRSSQERIRIHYGDAKTGRAWGDVETGRVGRSTGSIKIPICLHNARSIGGGAILDNCIVKIETTRAPRRVLYVHPTFQPAPLQSVRITVGAGKEFRGTHHFEPANYDASTELAKMAVRDGVATPAPRDERERAFWQAVQS